MDMVKIITLINIVFVYNSLHLLRQINYLLF